MGDATVVADLYRQHGAFVHTISQQLVGAAADRLTQQIFVEAWRDRLDFNPSLGTVRNWLARRARERVSKPSAEADAAVDRIVVADSLARMDDTRRRVLAAGLGSADVDNLARTLDLPVAAVNGHLRRGMDVLKSDLADSRPDGSDAALADMLGDGLPDSELIDPPLVAWNAIVAELRLTGEAADLDASPQAEADSAEQEESERPTTVDHEGDRAPGAIEDRHPGSELEVDNDPGIIAGADTGVDDTSGDAAVADAPHGDDMDALRNDAVLTDLNRPLWRNPAAVVVALIILGILIAIIF